MDSLYPDYSSRMPIEAPADWGDDIRIEGRCCACRERLPLRNVVCMSFRAPASAAGKGWGCVVCGLPADGAIAVVCDPCVQAGAPILDVCADYATQPERADAAPLKDTPYEHDSARHARDAGDGARS